ncbi:MAG: M20/M25/M40 family metallo-hydrolase, partial [Chrysiogenales bacterium]
NSFTSVHIVKPLYQPVIAYSVPWTSGTNGNIQADVVYLDSTSLFSEKDLLSFRDKFKGKIVCISPQRALKPNFKPLAVRLSQEELDDMAALKLSGHTANEQKPEGNCGPDLEKKSAEKIKPFNIEKVLSFLKTEGAVAAVFPGDQIGEGPMDKGVVLVNKGRPLKKGDPRPIAMVIFAAEHYNRVLRILEKGIAVTIEINVANTFSAENIEDYNIIAEIAGRDLKNEVVMLGAHFDGKSAGSAATDNAAGCAIVMEAMRILKQIGITPRRTIRVALWGAEEWGLLGSKGYVNKYLFDANTKKKLPGYDDFSVYFNVDWYGRFRGIYLQGNDLARPIFDDWMKPFHDLGMTYLVPGNTGGTDHMVFYEAGLPAFQFIQDDLEFFTTTFHTNMDVYDRLVADDLKQAAVVLAGFALNAAMSQEKIPRYGSENKDRRWHK